MKQKFVIMNSVIALTLLAALVFMVVNVAAAISHAINVGSTVSFKAVGKVSATVTVTHTAKNAIFMQKNSETPIENEGLTILPTENSVNGEFYLANHAAIELVGADNATEDVTYRYTITIRNNYHTSDAATYKDLKVTYTPPAASSYVTVSYDGVVYASTTDVKTLTISPESIATITVKFTTPMEVFSSANLTSSFILENAEPSGEEEEIDYWDGSAAANFAGGDGTEANPYLISNGNELALLAYLINNQNTATSCTNAEYTINGKTTTINVRPCGTGVTFGTAYYKQTKNIYLNDETFTFEEDTGLVKVTDGTNTCYLGTGINDTTMGAVYSVNDGSVEPSAAPETNAILTYGSAENSSTVNYWTPIGNESNQFLGTYDGNSKTVSGIYINNESESDPQGLFGFTGSGSTIKNVGVVNSYIKGHEYVGGVCGWNYGTITNCYNTGTVSGIAGVGGVCGDTMLGTITNCYNTGTVSGSHSNSLVGGVCGLNESGTITNCYNTGTVSGPNWVGGVCGLNYGTITNCYNTGTVSCSGNFVGGVCGFNYEGTIENCYYLSGTASYGIGDTTSDTSGVTTGLTLEQMTDEDNVATNYSGWDFTNTWAISSSVNNGLPYLRNN